MEEAQAGEPISGEELREASFPQARRGYDREAVHAFLDRVADWLEEKAPGTGGATQGLTSEFAKVGERTAGILTAAEEAAAKMRREAKEYAQKLRSATDEEVRKARVNATTKADELLAEAESKAEGIVEEAVARRRRLNEAVASLLERRDEIADEAQRLADQLLETVEALRSEEPIDDIEGDEAPVMSEGADEAERSRLIRAGFKPGSPSGGGGPAGSTPPDQRETAIHDPDRARQEPQRLPWQRGDRP